jgi:Spy/CpxP family protein refolding chaperone
MFLLMSAPMVAQSQNPTPEEMDRMKLVLMKLSAAQAEAAALKSRTNAASASPLTSLLATVKGTFWRNPDWVKLLDLTTDQQKKMDDIFQQYRLKLIDLTASLQKEELILEPLLGTTRPSPEVEPKILTQIDRIADARAELEKATSRMLVGILQVLNAEQWTKLPIPPKKEPTIFNKPGK